MRLLVVMRPVWRPDQRGPVTAGGCPPGGSPVGVRLVEGPARRRRTCHRDAVHSRWSAPWSVTALAVVSVLALFGVLATVPAVGSAAGGRLVATGLQGADAQQAARDQQALDRRLPALWAFVQEERGLTKRRDVPVEVLDDDAYSAALEDGDWPEADNPTATALGQDGAGRAADDSVGFYDDVSKRVFVRADEADLLEQTVVHELTHALQDQWFGFSLSRPWADGEGDRALAYDALVEGDAMRVERAWYASRPAGARAHVDALELERYGAPVSRGSGRYEQDFDADIDFPYVAGRLMVEAVLAKGGQPLLDATFVTPPLSTAQVLHPALVGSGYPPSPPPPSGPGELVDSGTLGELGLALLLGEDPTDPDAPEVGWQGDTYRTYETADETCLYARIEMADADSRDEVVDVVRDLDEDGLRARAEGPASLTLTSCGS